MKKEHTGLSPSSFALFQGCNRRYFYEKVLKLPPDIDYEKDQDSFELGKAVHRVLELRNHELKGVTYDEVRVIAEEFNFDHDALCPMIFAMLGAYSRMHDAAQLKTLACEVELETPTFYGFVDAVMADPLGWWITDVKTASSFNESIIPSLPNHAQLNLYSAHASLIALKLGLDEKAFRGCRYRMVTKSKMIRKDSETVNAFVGRLSKVVKAYDFIIPHELLRVKDISQAHAGAYGYIEDKKHNLNPADFPQNYGNCMSYFRPCQHWGKCHGRNYSQDLGIQVIES